MILKSRYSPSKLSPSNNMKLQLTIEEEKLLNEYQQFFSKLGINIERKKDPPIKSTDSKRLQLV